MGTIVLEMNQVYAFLWAAYCFFYPSGLSRAITSVWLAFGLLTPISLLGQNYFAVDKLALNTPPSKTTTIKTLAEYLCADQKDETYKARAIYAWVTLNVAYVDSTDVYALWATPEHLKRQSPDRVLHNRTAVCQGYANLYCALMNEAGLACEVVSGLVKNEAGEVGPIGHAWAAARIDGEWRLFDPTWGVPPPGMTRWEVVDKFFMADPKAFVLQHLPDDPLWQLLESPVSENRFRNASAEEILAFLESNAEEVFHFRDTLAHWYTMDSLRRLLASEGRILRFNGSNDRVIFGLGQSYWRLFFELRSHLNTLTDEAILSDTVSIDTAWFETQIGLLGSYHLRAQQLFERLETPERIEKTAELYSPEEVDALLNKIRGDMWTGVFEYWLHRMPPGVLNERQVAQLNYQSRQLQQCYARSEQTLDCAKIGNRCFDISDNRSLVAIQMAQRQMRFAQNLANENTGKNSLKTITLNLSEARYLFLQAIEDCERMRRRPPKFAFVDERLATAQQGLLTLRTVEIRAERTALSPELEDILNLQKFSIRKAENLADRMARIGRSIEQLEDSLENAETRFGTEFSKIALFNLHVENFALQFNLANLRFRTALNEYETALGKNNLAGQKEHIRSTANRAIQTLKLADRSLDYLEDSGQMPTASINKKQLQINKLSRSLQDFLGGF